MRVLGIETSCDETGIAIYDGSTQQLLADALYSQVPVHAEYGGVVPELASRDHIRKTLPMIQTVLGDAQLSLTDINAIAYTNGPGLIGALMVGATVGRALAYSLGIPAVAVHHMEGHLLAPMLEDGPPAFPFIALLVSGGHTQLVRVDGIGRYQLLGESLDDAAGEAFDKAAKMMGLPYPGGPQIAKLAEQGDASKYHFPRPMVKHQGLDFSFSGLKTYTMNVLKQDDVKYADVAAAFQQAVIDTLVIKCRRALQQEQLTRLVIAGGVSANLQLRQQLTEQLAKISASIFYARPHLCTDNGAMIAYAGCQRIMAGQVDDLMVRPKARWSMDQLSAL